MKIEVTEDSNMAYSDFDIHYVPQTSAERARENPFYGGDWHQSFQSSDDTIPEEDIKRYYDIAMNLKWENAWDSTPEMKEESKTPDSSFGYKHITLCDKIYTTGGNYEIEQDWVQEIWDKVNPGLKLIRHTLIGHHKHQSAGIHMDGWTGNQYTVIVYLTPDWHPDDGGTIEFWTPNLTDKMKALAINTPYGFAGSPDMNIVKSYWPKAGRVVVFDARIPHVARAVQTDKFRVSLVFMGQSTDE